MYVRDLEMKSKYLEGECRRLGRLLQCFDAENQALRLSLHNGGSAFGTSWAKQESAVLLLESLLLGSLVWFLGIICLFCLPNLPQSVLEAIPQEIMEKKDPESMAPRGRGSKIFTSSVEESFAKSRRCKASRRRMKSFAFSVCPTCLSQFWRPFHRKSWKRKIQKAWLQEDEGIKYSHPQWKNLLQRAGDARPLGEG